MFYCYKKSALAIISVCALAASVSQALAADALAFNRSTIQTSFKLTHPLLPADILSAPGKEVIAFGVDDEGGKWLAIYGQNPQTHKYEQLKQLALPADIYGFDVSEDEPDRTQGLFFLSSSQVLQWQGESEQAFKPIAKVQSLSLSPRADFISRVDFIRDVNGDKLADIVIADFTQVHLWLSTAEGGNDNQWQVQSLPITSLMRQFAGGTSYTLAKLYVGDMDLDGRVDLVTIGEGEFEVYRQREGGLFETLPWFMPSRLALSGRDWWDRRDAYGESLDQSNLLYRKVEELKDINHDGLIDLVVRYSRSSGVLDKSNDYEIYLGTAQKGKLVFPLKPDSVVKADGVLTDLKFVDIDKDEKSEVLVAGLDIGLSQIIGALLSGSIDQDMHLFRQDAKGNFGDSASVSKRVEIKFSLTSGESGSPVVALADLNGDGLKDLLLSDGDDGLQVYLGEPGDKVFGSRSQEVKLTLPQDGDKLITEDLNGDGREDILISYGRQDDTKLQHSFTILLAD